MKKILLYISLALFSVPFISCGSVNSDAKKAAELTNKSIEQSVNLDFEKAEKNYKKARQIILKYEEHKKSEKFHQLYREYRDKGKLSSTKEP